MPARGQTPGHWHVSPGIPSGRLRSEPGPDGLGWAPGSGAAGSCSRHAVRECRMPAPRLSGEESCQFGAVAPEPPQALLVPAAAPVQTFNGTQPPNLGLPMKGNRLSFCELSAQTEPKACCLEDAISLIAQDPSCPPPSRFPSRHPSARRSRAGAGCRGTQRCLRSPALRGSAGVRPGSCLPCRKPGVLLAFCACTSVLWDRGPAASLGPPGGRRCGGSQMGKAVPHGGSLKNCRLKVSQKSKRAFPALPLSLPPLLPPPKQNSDDTLASRACAAWEADSGRGPCAHSPAPRCCSPRGPSGQGNAAPNSELALMQALALLSCLLPSLVKLFLPLQGK